MEAKLAEVTIPAMDLAALLASRVCHDIISPVGAIANGLEVLDEEDDESMREFAMDLIRKSAKQASAKLQFARLAFGASGSAGAEIDMNDAGVVVSRYLEREKANVDWRVASPLLPKTHAKLLLNLVHLGAQSIARGGTLIVTADRDGDTTAMQLSAEGERAKFPAAARDVVLSGVAPEPLDAHGVQPLYTYMLARESGLRIAIHEEENKLVIGVQPDAGTVALPSDAA